MLIVVDKLVVEVVIEVEEVNVLIVVTVVVAIVLVEVEEVEVWCTE